MVMLVVVVGDVLRVVVAVTVVVDVVGVVDFGSGPCMSSRIPKMISPISTAMSRPIAANPYRFAPAGDGFRFGLRALLPP